MALELRQLFPDEDYGFRLTLRKGDLDGFFRQPNSSVLAERRHWLNLDSGRFASALDGAGPLISEFESLANSWIARDELSVGIGGAIADPLARLGSNLEPDFMLLSRRGDDFFRLLAGVVCFPSSWALRDKMGQTLDEIHGPVPGLNAKLGGPIGQFPARLKPDVPYERANWGLTATSELNMHPSLQRPRLTLPLDPSRIWLRIEDQIFASLPTTGGVLFGIRLRIIPLAEIVDNPLLRNGFRRALLTMPPELASYKGLGAIRADLIAILG